MDAGQREAFRDLVILAMNRKAWSAATTAKAAGISENTMTKVTRAESVAPGTISKLCTALGIEPLADAQAKEGYSIEIELVRDTIGLILRDTPEADRPALVHKIFKAIFSPSDSTADTTAGVE